MTHYIRNGHKVHDGVAYTLQRRLPGRGMILGRLGATVRPETVVAEGKVASGFRVLRLAELLGVPPDRVPGCLHRTIGSRVYRGDVIAEATRTFGLRTVQCLAPVDGVLQELNPATGYLTLQYSPVTFRLPAGVHGTIEQIVPDEGVAIRTAVTTIAAAFTAGNTRDGAVHVIAPPDRPINPAAIDASLAGHIIAGGSHVSRDVLNRCLALGVRGVVSGGIAATDLLAVSGNLNDHEDVGVTVLITEGLGDVPMDAAVYATLERYHEQHVFLVPHERILIAPLPAGTVAAAGQGEDTCVPLRPGLQVVIRSRDGAGTRGVVVKIMPPRAPETSSRPVPYCLLELADGATIEVPVTNISLASSPAHS